MDVRGPADPGRADGSGSAASRYSIAVLARLVDTGLAEVVVEPDGTPSLQIDPIFEQARAAAMAGFADIDQMWAAERHLAQHLRPTG